MNNLKIKINHRLYIKEQITQNNNALQCISSSLKSMKELYWRRSLIIG